MYNYYYVCKGQSWLKHPVICHEVAARKPRPQLRWSTTILGAADTAFGGGIHQKDFDGAQQILVAAIFKLIIIYVIEPAI